MIIDVEFCSCDLKHHYKGINKIIILSFLQEANEKFQQLQKVMSVLGDEEKRAVYDQTGCVDDAVSGYIDLLQLMFRYNFVWICTIVFDPVDICLTIHSYTPHYGALLHLNSENFCQNRKPPLLTLSSDILMFQTI